MNFIGIDPGKDGALAIIDNRDKLHIVGFKKFLDTPKPLPILQFMNGLIYVENVHAFPGQGSTSIFEFGRALGNIEGRLYELKKTWNKVTPQQWQKTLGLAGQYPTKVARKQAHLRLAKQMFPDVDIKLAEADAVLIAAYARATYIREAI